MYVNPLKYWKTVVCGNKKLQTMVHPLEYVKTVDYDSPPLSMQKYPKISCAQKMCMYKTDAHDLIDCFIHQ